MRLLQLVVLAAASFAPAAPARHDPPARNDVVLQLPDVHGFRFAGYYAAVERGFYRAEGLDVVLREADGGESPEEAVLSDRAQYGVLGSRLVRRRAEGAPLVLVAAMLHDSLTRVVVRADSSIASPCDLAGRTIAVDSGADENEIVAMLLRQGIRRDGVRWIHRACSPDDVASGRIDALVVASRAAAAAIRSGGREIRAFTPRNVGLDFCGDALFTSEREIERDPERAAAMRRATVRGWEYARTHVDEAIGWILGTFGAERRGATRAALLAEAEEIWSAARADARDFGALDAGRWRANADALAELGLAPRVASLDGFFFRPASPRAGAWLRWSMWIAASLALFLAVVAFWGIHLQHVVNERTRELRQKNRELERKTVEREELLERLQLQIDRMPVGCLLTDAKLLFTHWNPAAEAIFGFTLADVIGKHPFDVIVPEESQPLVASIFKRLGEGDMSAHGTCVNATKDGRTIVCEWHNTPLQRADGTFVGVLSVAQDVTDQRRLQEQLLQAQKMDSIGRLAGGIAHDFNNLLTAIIGYAQLADSRLSRAGEERGDIEQILQAAERAASLTRQLLAFARRQIVEPRVLSLNDRIVSLEPMLRRLLGEDVRLMSHLHPDLGRVRVDPGQLEQVVVNLVVNARDAMPDGGLLTIRTSHESVQAGDDLGGGETAPGEYVALTVSDTGTGIPPDVKAHLFEPFFTTKPPGCGTGLGLATCYGVVKQAGGAIVCATEVGHGTTFTVLLPRVGEPASTPPRLESSSAPLGRETILVAEDETLVRNIAASALRSLGYRVLEAGDGVEALEIASSHDGSIDLLLTDVVMPRMDGKELADRMRGERPSVEVLFMSGYTDDAIVQHGVLEPGIAFLQKPFTPDTLGHRVRELLDGARVG